MKLTFGLTGLLTFVAAAGFPDYKSVPRTDTVSVACKLAVQDLAAKAVEDGFRPAGRSGAEERIVTE